MSSALPRKASDRVNTYGIMLIGLVSSVLLWVSVVALQAYYNRTAGQLQGERDAAFKNRQVNDIKSTQMAELQDSKYVDPKKGRVTIPIDSAKGLVLRDLRDGAPSLVPAVGPHDKATVPAKWGRPPDQVAAPAGAAPGAPAAGGAPADPGAAPAGGQPAAGTAGQPAAGKAGQESAGAAPAGGAPATGGSASGAAPAAGAGPAPGGAKQPAAGAALPPGSTPGTTATPREPGASDDQAAGAGKTAPAPAGKAAPTPSGKAAPASPPAAPATGNQ